MIVQKILVSTSNIEVIKIGFIICNHKDLFFETLKIHVFHAYCLQLSEKSWETFENNG